MIDNHLRISDLPYGVLFESCNNYSMPKYINTECKGEIET